MVGMYALVGVTVTAVANKSPSRTAAAAAVANNNVEVKAIFAAVPPIRDLQRFSPTRS